MKTNQLNFWHLSLKDRINNAISIIESFKTASLDNFKPQLRGYVLWIFGIPDNPNYSKMFIDKGFRFSDSRKAFYMVMQEKGKNLNFSTYSFKVESNNKYKATPLKNRKNLSQILNLN
jgi:hypothetical protein